MRNRTLIFLVTLLFSISSLASSKTRSCSFVFSNFSETLYNGTQKLTKSDSLSSRHVVSIGRKGAAAFFDNYSNLWQMAFDADGCEAVLGKIIEGQDINTTEIALLKRVRKSGSALRNAFMVFDYRHEVPKDFEDFVIKFGKLNDLLALPWLTTDEMEEIHKLAGKIFEEIHERHSYLTHITDEFQASKREKLQEDLKEDSLAARKLVAHSKLNEEDQHRLRKIMRKFLYYQLAVYDTNPSEDNRMAYQLLYEISAEMGDNRDQFFGQIAELKKRGAKIPKSLKKFSISDSLRREILTYLNFIQI